MGTLVGYGFCRVSALLTYYYDDDRTLSLDCRMARELHYATRRITANHAFGPPSLKVKSFKSGRTS
jgi:hypothetical protein